MQPFPILAKSKTSSIPILALTRRDYDAWIKKQPLSTARWLKVNGFSCEGTKYCLMPGQNGEVVRVLCAIEDDLNLWSLSHLPQALPSDIYHLEGNYSAEKATQLALGWALGCYQFTRYKKNDKPYAMLLAPRHCDLRYVESMAGCIAWARDLINTPANDMNPRALADEATRWAKSVDAQINVIRGEELLKANYPTIYAVGKAASVPPHLVDIRFTRKGAPKVTLVGKGVCFDSGGLDIKSTANMKLMKKDMGGAAIVLGLARALVETDVPVSLRILLPIVENAVSGNAMRPLDIVKTRKGITVEIGNTDAEGRLILCDALFEADGERPDLLIDCATLTGAARVAMGTEIAAFFTPDDKLAKAVMSHSQHESDAMWRLPLWKPYRSMLKSSAADISNDPDSAYGGAITAALYLQEFVSKTPSWLHIDTMAWNVSSKPGRPQGGEPMTIRALYSLIKEQYGHQRKNRIG